jgi:hypothetical protein
VLPFKSPYHILLAIAAATATTTTPPSAPPTAAMTLYFRRFKICKPGQKRHLGVLEQMLADEAAKRKKEEKEKKRVETARVRFTLMII